MVIGLTYFLILQTLVFATFYFKRNDKDDFALSKLFPTKIHFLTFNICIFLACYFYNSERQLFCRPVPWAATLIILFCISFLALPILTRQSKLSTVLSAICGLGLFIAVYTLLFARQEYLIYVAYNIPIFLLLHFLSRQLKKKYQTNIFDAFYLYPAIILTPFLLLFQLWTLFKTLQTNQKRLFIATPILTLFIGLALTLQMDNIVHKIVAAQDKEKEIKIITTNPINNYLTELYLGAHWKYHTELCLYDGWRPPFHDPVLVMALKIRYAYFWYIDYPRHRPSIGSQLAYDLYKLTYPNNPTKFDCKCATHERLIDLD